VSHILVGWVMENQYDAKVLFVNASDFFVPPAVRELCIFSGN
jgi:hypothetical protein